MKAFIFLFYLFPFWRLDKGRRGVGKKILRVSWGQNWFLQEPVLVQRHRICLQGELFDKSSPGRQGSALFQKKAQSQDYSGVKGGVLSP